MAGRGVERVLVSLVLVRCEHAQAPPSPRAPPPPGAGEPRTPDADCPGGTYCAAIDGGIVCVLPSASPVPCGYAPSPHTGDACEAGALPDGYVCRERSGDQHRGVDG